MRDVKLGNFAGKEYESIKDVRTRARVFRTKRHDITIEYNFNIY